MDLQNMPEFTVPITSFRSHIVGWVEKSSVIKIKKKKLFEGKGAGPKKSHGNRIAREPAI
jgi:hypothetical protein